MGVIEWLPIAELPEELKDGRAVLLFYPGGARYKPAMLVGNWSPPIWEDDDPGFWEGPYSDGIECRLTETILIADDARPTHFAEINGPEGG